MIPREIHYCWFGRNKISSTTRKCIQTWKKYFPDYKIVEWNENNFDTDCCDYVKEAYKAGKWAFVSDYARLYVLYHQGGIYLDTDVEVLNNFEDLLQQGNVLAREPVSVGGLINPGLVIATEKGNPTIRKILDRYDQEHFLLANGKENQKTIGQYISEMFRTDGFESKNGKIQYIDNFYVYPSEYFCPLCYNGDGRITENSKTVHLYNASWYPLPYRKLIQLGVMKARYPERRILYLFETAFWCFLKLFSKDPNVRE